MTTKERKEFLINLRCDLVNYLFETIDDNPKIKKYFDKYLNFCTFEIDYFEEIGDFEYVQFDLSAQNTGNIFRYRHNIKTDEYILTDNPAIFSSKVDNFDISKEILKEIFDVARKNKTLLKLEKKLTEEVIKIKSIS
ncbi:MAG: hypothetical protein IKL65_03030 [Bacilli bacterium]|nr:hypothetical protein [Bacilli bacterium]